MRNSQYLVLGIALALSGELVAGRRGLLAPEAAAVPLPTAIKAIEDGELTASYYVGSQFAIDITAPSEVYCPKWDVASRTLVNDTERGLITGPGPFEVPSSDYAGVVNQLCAEGAAGNTTISSALIAGGDEARNVLAALVWGACSDPNALLNAYAAFLNSTEMRSGDTLLPIAQNYVKAAGELGIACCAAVVTLDANMVLVDLETFATGEGAGAPAPAPLPGGSDAPLPDGVVYYWLAWAPRMVQCMDYSPDSPTKFVENSSAPSWMATGYEQPDPQDEQEFANEICDTSKSPAQEILDALAAGGERAIVAVAVLIRNVCGDVRARDAAFDSLFSSQEMNDPATLLPYIRSFVDACDAFGTGCCFTVVVVDPSTNAVLDTRRIHPGGSDDSPSPPSSPLASPSPLPSPPSGGGATLEQCKAQLNAASSGCSGIAIVPGSSCCTAVLGLGSECLAVLASAASQPGADPVTAVAVTTLFTKCGISSGGSPPTGGSPPAGGGCQGDPLQAFQAVLNTCDLINLSSGTPCCNSFQALGSGCLSQALAASAGDASKEYLVKGIATRCEISLDVSGEGAPPAPPADSPPASQLPEGITKIGWNVGYPAICTMYSSAAGEYVNMTSPTYWNASGSNRPSDAETAPLISQLCQGASAGDAFEEGVAQGGETAQAWVAAFFLANCSTSIDAFDALSASLRAKEPNDALGYVRSFVAALQSLGIGSCVTVTSVDSSGSVLGEVQVHTDVPVSAPATSRRRLRVQPAALPAAAQGRLSLRTSGLQLP